MCRWVFYIGQQPVILEDILIKPDHAIVEQVNERFLPGLYYGLETDDKADLKTSNTWLNVHGFGVAWYTDVLSQFDPKIKDMQPALFKTVSPISTEIAFHQLCGHTASRCVLAHIRAASFPPVVEVNNHPFIFGKYTFMHNGGVNSFGVIRFQVLRRIHQLQEIVQAKPELRAIASAADGNYIFGIKGNTDTEHLATLYFAHLDLVKAGIITARKKGGQAAPAGKAAPTFDTDSTDAMLLALINTINDIHRIQAIHKVGPFTPNQNRAGNTFNLCIADGGEQVLVLRWKDSLEGFPPSLYLSLTAAEKLNRKYYPDPPTTHPSNDIHNEDVQIDTLEKLVERYQKLPPGKQGRHVVVGSEPMTREVDEWGLFNPNQVVAVEKSGRLRIINFTKFFQKGRESEFENYKFDHINNHIATTTGIAQDAPDAIGIPQHTVDLPSGKSHPIFEVDFDLK
jgi:glutamine amidotransferase